MDLSGWTAFLFLVFGLCSSQKENLPSPCDSLIYCHGSLLHTVQLAGLYKDSKTFVDMSLKSSPESVLQRFEALMSETKGQPSKEEVQKFVDDNFNEPGTEFENWDPEDWQPDPEFLNKIVDPELQEWGNELHKLWKELGRKISVDVKNDPQKYSQIYVENPVIVPGGRFREFYYWDTYWTFEGLLLSNMSSTVRGMLQNFVNMVDAYGMVPNGGRVYYTRRSQPPYLIPMVDLYLEYTDDYDFMHKILNSLEEEFQFWVNHRRSPMRDKNGKVHHVFQYNVQVGGPRPEAYKEDYEIAQNKSNEREQEDMYVQFKSGAESGWDYSTRWFVVEDSRMGDLSDLNVTSIVPVDLNSLLCHNARLLSEFFAHAGNEAKSKEYDDLANVLNQTMADIFWDEVDGIWHDVNFHTGEKRRMFYLSNVHPIWSGCYGLEGSRPDTMAKVIDYLKRTKVSDYIGGVPTSLKDSGEQWDYPNAWAPLEHIAITGLYNGRSMNIDAEEMAFDLAEKWVKTGYQGYTEANAMFEKYDVNVLGAAGRGGEYNVQLGFGWSNGVAMKLLDMYGDRLSVTVASAERGQQSYVSLLLTTFAALLWNQNLQPFWH